MPIQNTQWADQVIDSTAWPTFPDQADPNNLWDNASDAWDNAGDTWDAFFASGSDANPVTTAWSTDL